MDLGIKELGVTFIIGAFTILGLESILHHFFNKQLTGFFRGRLGLTAEKPANEQKKSEATDTDDSSKRHEESPMTAAVFIGLAFAIGVLAEDVSYKYRDTLGKPFGSVSELMLPRSLVYALDLPLKYDLRVYLLFKDDAQSDKLVPQPLAEDLARTKSFSLVDPEYGEKIERWIVSKRECTPTSASVESCLTVKELEHATGRLYYYAKNKAFAEDNYYDEMKKIQLRMDFSRSLAMIAFVYFVLALVIALFFTARRLAILLFPLEGPLIRGGSHTNKKLLVRGGVVLVVLFSLYVVAIWAFVRESDEFNKRAFGYYSTTRIKGNTPTALSPPSGVVTE